MTSQRRSPRSVAAEAAFRGRVTELGGTVIEPTWLGVGKPHRVLCASGHECAPYPANVRNGIGICQTCAGVNPRVAEAAFRARVAELGGTVIEPTWLGVGKPHRVLCASGHECAPHPSGLKRGCGLCQTCARNDPRAAEAAFRARVAELGGTVIEPTWLGANVPHRVRCRAGHESAPAPHSVQRGSGICRKCSGREWDAFYVVLAEDQHRLKFGITSGDPRPRLRIHKRAGYRTIVRSLTALPGTIAPDIERLVISALHLAGEQPIRGREYYGAHVLVTVLDVVDNYPMPTDAQRESQLGQAH